MNDLILYTTDDGRSQIKLRADQQTVWLTQLEIAELFDATKQNIVKDGELDPAAVVESLTAASWWSGQATAAECSAGQERRTDPL